MTPTATVQVASRLPACLRIAPGAPALACLALIFNPSALAADPGCVPDGVAPAQPPALSQGAMKPFDRLAGYWRGQGFGGLVEEWWSPRDGNEMFGVFRGSHDGKTDLYEFMKVELAADRPRQIVRHLDAGGAPWVYKPEDTVFSLVSVSEDCIRFDAVTYRFLGPNEIAVTVLVTSAGKTSAAQVHYRRAAAQ